MQPAFDAALSGKGALAMVVGEPGIGKTAVCEQLATYVTLRGGTTLYGHCYEEGSLSLPYLAFFEALRSYAVSRPPDVLRQELGMAACTLASHISPGDGARKQSDTGRGPRRPPSARGMPRRPWFCISSTR